MKDFARFCQLAVLLVSSGELVPELEGFLAYGLFAEDAFRSFRWPARSIRAGSEPARAREPPRGSPDRSASLFEGR